MLQRRLIMNMQSGFQQADPAGTGYQYLEDLSTAYWYSQVLFTSLELNIFGCVENGATDIDALAGHTGTNPDTLFRLLTALVRMALLIRDGDQWYNTQMSVEWLVPGREGYMGELLLYRQYMGKNWSQLTAAVGHRPGGEKEKISYKERNFHYVRAMDILVRQKAQQIAAIVPETELTGPILDVGGGAGSMIRHLWQRPGSRDAFLFDLDETIEAAIKLYPDAESWNGIRVQGGDFRTHLFDRKFGLILLSNFLHAYGRKEAKRLLSKAVSLLHAGGRLLIHDYFPDRSGVNPQKGALYDLAMMVNTYNGACHEAGLIMKWLEELNVPNIEIRDLDTDSSFILAGGEKRIGINPEPWLDLALAEGFSQAAAIDPGSVVTGPWVVQKCRFGCEGYGKNLQCPPNAMPVEETRRLLDAYSRAVVVQGTPPGKAFHEQLLRLERRAFLQGFHKALVFGAGPCPVCPDCPESGECRNHKKARPSMESCGIDVYATAHKAGLPLSPVKEKGQFVKYTGLLLLE
jgi:predicted metal-binding protein